MSSSFYQEGYDAYDHTKGLLAVWACPYRIGTYARKAWIDGYRACRYLCVSNAMTIGV